MAPIDLPVREQPTASVPSDSAAPLSSGSPAPGHLSHLTDIERAAYCQAVAEALALLNAEASNPS